MGFGGILGPPYYGIGATIRIGREMLCLLYAFFFKYHNSVYIICFIEYLKLLYLISAKKMY